MSKNDGLFLYFYGFYQMQFLYPEFTKFGRMHINDTDLISVGLHMKTVKQITGIWFGKQARMVMIPSVTFT